MSHRGTRSQNKVDADVTHAQPETQPKKFASPSTPARAEATAAAILLSMYSSSPAEQQMQNIPRRNAISAAAGQTTILGSRSPDSCRQLPHDDLDKSPGFHHTTSHAEEEDQSTMTASSVTPKENGNAPANVAASDNHFLNLASIRTATVPEPVDYDRYIVEAPPLPKMDDADELLLTSPKDKGKGKAMAMTLPEPASQSSSQHQAVTQPGPQSDASFMRRFDKYKAIPHANLLSLIPPFDPDLFRTDLPHEFYKIQPMHTAKCTVCKKHNKDILFMCMTCTVSICTPCADIRCPAAGANGDRGEDGVMDDVGTSQTKDGGAHNQTSSSEAETPATEIEWTFNWCGEEHEVFGRAYVDWKEERAKEHSDRIDEGGNYKGFEGVKFNFHEPKQGGRKKGGSAKKKKGAAKYVTATPTKTKTTARGVDHGKKTPEYHRPGPAVGSSTARTKPRTMASGSLERKVSTTGQPVQSTSAQRTTFARRDPATGQQTVYPPRGGNRLEISAPPTTPRALGQASLMNPTLGSGTAIHSDDDEELEDTDMEEVGEISTEVEQARDELQGNGAGETTKVPETPSFKFGAYGSKKVGNK